MNQLRFRVTRQDRPAGPPMPELLGDWVKRWVAPVASLIRWPADCPGCENRRAWLNQLHRKAQAIFGPTGGSDPK